MDAQGMHYTVGYRRLSTKAIIVEGSNGARREQDTWRQVNAKGSYARDCRPSPIAHDTRRRGRREGRLALPHQ
jgi:hypothetical protein